MQSIIRAGKAGEAAEQTVSFITGGISAIIPVSLKVEVEMSGKLYLAYGSNMDTAHMRRMCPSACLLGAMWLDGFRLAFRSTDGITDVTLEPCETGRVPAVLWEITTANEAALDEYEEYPRLYFKQTVSVCINGQPADAMVYLLNGGEPTATQPDYMALIRQGYAEAGFDPALLEAALDQS